MYTPVGVMVASVTPMRRDESINLQELENHINRIIAGGIHGIFCLGTNGEFYAMSPEERQQVTEATVAIVGGRVPVLAGAGAISTRETINLVRTSEDLGVDAVSVITPYFVPLTQKEMLRHYRAVAEATSLPVMLYNIPNRTGNHLEASTVGELARMENIVGIKDSSGKLQLLQDYIDAVPEDFAVFSGNDSLILSALKIGAKGAIAAIANICPAWLAGIYDAWKCGDLDTAASLQSRVDAVRGILPLGNPNTMVKRAVNLLGYPVGPAREPVSGIADADQDEGIRTILESVGLLPVRAS
jgi:4-hydroxy-tetrahydrodipicolinate synthase